MFFIAPGPLTFDLFEHGFDARMALGWARCSPAPASPVSAAPAWRRTRPYIIRFTEDRPNPLYRRVCYTFAWSEVITFALLNVAGLVVAIVTGQWYSKQIYRVAYFPVAGLLLLLGALGQLPRVRASTKGEGHERRYFYGSVWAVCWAQPTLWLLWKILPQNRPSDAFKLAVFVGILAFVGNLRDSAGCLARVRLCPANSPSPTDAVTTRTPRSQGWQGWDDYAPFYDWENARTLGRRDVSFWTRVAAEARGDVLELGCGTGRISLPLIRAGVPLVGVDRSDAMLARAARRAAALRGHGRRRRAHLRLVRGDIRALPLRRNSFGMVLAPYGVLQSLLRDRDLVATLDSVHDVLQPGGLFGLDLVPDVPQWKEYADRVQLRGRGPRGTHFTLIESVRQDPRRRLTIFTQDIPRAKGPDCDGASLHL